MMIKHTNIVLWRHADAVDAKSPEETDITRELSAKGRGQAKKMAVWLRHNLPKNTLVLTSPAVRAEQTAQALKWDYRIIKSLQPITTLSEVVNALQKVEANNVLLVGHQPWLGELAAYLLELPNTKAPLNSASIKKGAVWWFKQKKVAQGDAAQIRPYGLVSVQHPDFI